MSQPAVDLERLSERIELACSNCAELRALAGEVATLPMDDDDRTMYLSRIARFRCDLQIAAEEEAGPRRDRR